MEQSNIQNQMKPVFIESEHRYDFTQTTEDHYEIWRLYASMDNLWTESYRGRFIGAIKKTAKHYEILSHLSESALIENISTGKSFHHIGFSEQQIQALELLLRLARGNKTLDVFDNTNYPPIA